MVEAYNIIQQQRVSYSGTDEGAPSAQLCGPLVETQVFVCVRAGVCACAHVGAHGP